MISPQTGAIASFAEADRFVLAGANKALEQGLTIAGENHPVQILYKDSQSNPNRAVRVRGAADQPRASRSHARRPRPADTVIPVADQCELKGVPCITADDPWQSWLLRPQGQSTRRASTGPITSSGASTMLADLFVDMWQSLPYEQDDRHMVRPTIRTAWRPTIRITASAGSSSSKGFTVDDVGPYPPSATTSPRRSAELKETNCDIVCGIFNPPQFATFWTQCAQQNYRPENHDPAEGALCSRPPSRRWAIAALDISTEVWWSHHHPFKSGLTGEAAEQFCAYECLSDQGKQWTQPIGFKHANLEVAIDVAQARQEARADVHPRRDRGDRLPFTGRPDHLEGRHPPIRCRTSAPPRWSADNGRRARSSNTTSHRVQQRRRRNCARQRVRAGFVSRSGGRVWGAARVASDAAPASSIDRACAAKSDPRYPGEVSQMAVRTTVVGSWWPHADMEKDLARRPRGQAFGAGKRVCAQARRRQSHSGAARSRSR